MQYHFTLVKMAIIKKITGTSLVVQWLRIRLATKGMLVRSLEGELISQMPWGY